MGLQLGHSSVSEVLSQPGCTSTWSWHLPTLTQLYPSAQVSRGSWPRSLLRHARLGAMQTQPGALVAGRASIGMEDGAEAPKTDH